MRPLFAGFTLIIGMLLTAVRAPAHHSFDAFYAMLEKITVEGDVVGFLYRNPHSFLHMNSKDPATGALITWAVEWNGAKRLGREGVAPDTLKPGDHVVMTGQPGRKSEKYPELHRLRLETISRYPIIGSGIAATTLIDLRLTFVLTRVIAGVRRHEHWRF